MKYHHVLYQQTAYPHKAVYQLYKDLKKLLSTLQTYRLIISASLWCHKDGASYLSLYKYWKKISTWGIYILRVLSTCRLSTCQSVA